ncbi:MAG: Bro-N domain-containing protein [Spirochaetaceae bacterium]|nr:Bro-N domain-containing protein [Spirochaetaceae bacterium]
MIERDGQPWFVAKDVCAVLGYARPNDAVTAPCKHAKIRKHGEMPYLEIPARGVLIIPEVDLYRLIMRSNMPDAEKFQDGVIDRQKRCSI